MSAGMAGVIAAHVPTTSSSSFNLPEQGSGRSCRCGLRIEVLHSEMADTDSSVQPYLDRKLAAHMGEELAKAGYGKLDPLAAALADPEGHALMKAIHDRKAEA